MDLANVSFTGRSRGLLLYSHVSCSFVFLLCQKLTSDR